MLFALAGNQNCGKTTLFNQLTGSNQHVGNFPGVTVEGKTGEIRGLKDATVADLPGIYSLRPYSSEEIVSRDFILNNKPDGIINIVDATNIERNLYLTLQLLELGIPVVIALNMMDEIRNNGGSIDVAMLSERLGVPIVPISAMKGEGVDELITVAVNVARDRIMPRVRDFCASGAVHRTVHAISHIVEDHAERLGISPRFCAVKMFEGDLVIAERLGLSENEYDLIAHSIAEAESECGLDANAALADMRYTFIENVCRDTVKKPEESKERLRSIKIDNIVTNKYLAIPLFILIMFTVFSATFFFVGQALSDLMEIGISALTDWVDGLLTVAEINPVVHSLVIDGVFAGVGSVLSFLPLVVVLFFFLSILEDTGYMARVAFVMDKLLRRIGLSGRSIVPMLIGFGCTVPAVMATRTLSSDRDRKMTIMLTPFMSCSAKIPIYAVFAHAFFPKYSALVMTALYFGGILVGIIVALILNRTAFRGKAVPFVMELPNYRFPSPKSVLLLMWEKAKDFVTKAFTVIFVSSVVIWFLGAFDIRFNVVSESSESMLAMLGRLVAPIFVPLGLSDWRVATSLFAGLSAKEAVVSTLAVLMNTSVESLSSVLPTLFTPVSAITFLTFTLLYTPCVASIATIRREMNSTAKTVGIVILQCAIAWVCALTVSLIGNLISLI